jgi:hypothetical protein
MSQLRRGDVILSVPPYMASPSLTTAPYGSASLSAAQYSLPFTTTPLLPTAQAGVTSSIAVNPTQINTVITYAGPQPIGCTPIANPQANLVLAGSGVSPNGQPNYYVTTPGVIGQGLAIGTCYPIRFEGMYT